MAIYLTVLITVLVTVPLTLLIEKIVKRGEYHKKIYEENIKEATYKPVVEESNNTHLTATSVPLCQNKQEKEEKREVIEERSHSEMLLEEEVLKKEFNPRTTKPQNVEYILLDVYNGSLLKHDMGRKSYYRLWEYENRFFFEFYCDTVAIKKAINNHSSIIDPFCEKKYNSVSMSAAKQIKVVEYGELDSRYCVISKSKIIFE